MQTRGAGGPSQVDAAQYRHILAGKTYKKEGKEMRKQVALMAKTLATTITDPSSLESYIACRLIPLDKCPGLRPIGTGEVLRQIIGKTIGWVLKCDIRQLVPCRSAVV